MRRVLVLVAMSLMVSAVFRASAQSGSEEETERNEFYRVYGYETPFKGWFETTFWTTHVPKSNGDYDHFGQELNRVGLTNYSGEVEYGLTDKWSLSTYYDFQDPHGAGPRFTQGRIETRYRFANSYDHFLNMAVYAEYYIPRKGYGGSQELETRFIAEKDHNDLRYDMNVILETPTTGVEAGTAPRLGFDAGVYYRRYFRFQPGLEYYSDFGGISHPAPTEDQQHVLMPFLDIRLSRALDWQIGTGFGLTHASDSTVVRSMITYEFQGINPQRLFGHRGR